MFHVAICDDEIVVCTQLEKYLEGYKSKGIVYAEVFYSADKLYEALSRGEHYDLIFMDIEFKSSTGVEIVHKIRTELKNETIQIVYISAKQSYAMELFATRPMNFLVKPISEQDVIENVDKAMALADMQGSYFIFKFGKSNYRIPYGNILCFESDNRKIHIYTKDGVKEMYGQLKDIEAKAPETFVRIHQSYLINKLYVVHWNSEEIIMTNDYKFPVSNTYRKKMFMALMQSGRG